MVSNSNWVVEINRKEFFDNLGKELKFTTLDNFYNITLKTIKKYGGIALLDNLYNSSLIQAFEDVYSNHNWFVWKFSQNVPSNYWNNKNNQLKFLNELGKQLGFNQMNDWYNITVKDIKENGGSGLLNKYGNSPSKLIMTIYSNHEWKQSNFKNNPSKKRRKIAKISID